MELIHWNLYLPGSDSSTNRDSGLSVPVSVNELQRKLEEEVDRRRELWEEEQGKNITREECLTSATQQKRLDIDGEKFSHFLLH